MKKLSRLEAYKVMFAFLDRIYFEEGKNDDLGSLLGTMSLWEDREGGTMDAAAWADWEDIVQDKELNLDNTYNFMIDYMKEFNSTYNSKDLAEMIENFKLGDDQEKNKINLEYWEKAYSKVKEDSKIAMIKLLRKDYFSTVFEFKDNCRYTLWYCGKEYGFLIENKKIKLFDSLSDIQKFVCENNLYFNENEIITYKIDDLILKKESGIIDCKLMLDFWNITLDLSRSLKVFFSGDQDVDDINQIYNKLLSGYDLCDTKVDIKEHYLKWNNEEKQLLYKIIDEMIEILMRELDINFKED
ncbi:MAG: hypothetical protein ACI4PU_02175 [Intestinibacter sp.]